MFPNWYKRLDDAFSANFLDPTKRDGAIAREQRTRFIWGVLSLAAGILLILPMVSGSGNLLNTLPPMLLLIVSSEQIGLATSNIRLLHLASQITEQQRTHAA
jgi:hypothetical protein